MNLHNLFFPAAQKKPSDTLFADLLQALPVAVYTTDAEGHVTFFNEAAAALWGNRPALGEAMWSGAWKLYHPDGRVMPHDQSAMALALKDEREMRWDQAVAERPNGSRVNFMSYPTLLRDQSGEVVGAVNTLVDLTDRIRAGDASAKLAAIVESSMDAVVSKDLDGVITSWNDAAQNLFGYRPEEAIGQNVLILIPPAHQQEEADIIRRIREGKRVDTFETVRRRKDGSLVPVSLTISPVRDDDGRIVGASKIARDISARKDDEQRIRLLMREVNHRVKNQYAVILSMIRETTKRAKSPVEFERQVRERIMALSKSHDLLVSGEWRGVTIFELLATQIKPFSGDQNLAMSGPPLSLRPNAVQYLGIAFHELATNSAKYGVLSGGAGKIAIDWQIIEDAEKGDRFRLTWTETGGPRVEPLTGGGFGTVVLERVAPQALSGTGAIEHSPQGLSWTIEAPMNCVEASLEADSIG